MIARTIVLAVVAMAAALLPATAQDYPQRPITVVVPYVAGGTIARGDKRHKQRQHGGR